MKTPTLSVMTALLGFAMLLTGLTGVSCATSQASQSDSGSSTQAASADSPLPDAAPGDQQGGASANEASPIAWSDDAKAAFDAEVPKFVQKLARKSMEKKARERGIILIDLAFYQEMKREQGF